MEDLILDTEKLIGSAKDPNTSGEIKKGGSLTVPYKSEETIYWAHNCETNEKHTVEYHQIFHERVCEFLIFSQ